MKNINHHYGGIDLLAHLLPKVQQRTKELINGYIQLLFILENIESYVASPRFGDQSGMFWAVELTEKVLQPS